VRTLGALLFPDFELLDVFGPLEVFGNRNFESQPFEVRTVAETAGPVTSAQGTRALADHGFDDCPPLDVVMVPGGMGTRHEVENHRLLDWVRTSAERAELVLSVCTGAAILARAGVLDGKRATTNKRSLEWVVSQGPRVEWVRRARWVEDGRFVTSSGVTAGIDMALAVLARVCGRDEAVRIAGIIEHVWREDAIDDPFARGIEDRRR
jgi:transcriptional regulator GlxA family with amidase domain